MDSDGQEAQNIMQELMMNEMMKQFIQNQLNYTAKAPTAELADKEQFFLSKSLIESLSDEELLKEYDYTCKMYSDFEFKRDICRQQMFKRKLSNDISAQSFDATQDENQMIHLSALPTKFTHANDALEFHVNRQEHITSSLVVMKEAKKYFVEFFPKKQHKNVGMSSFTIPKQVMEHVELLRQSVVRIIKSTNQLSVPVSKLKECLKCSVPLLGGTVQDAKLREKQMRLLIFLKVDELLIDYSSFNLNDICCNADCGGPMPWGFDYVCSKLQSVSIVDSE